MSDESRLLMENQRNALMIKKLLGTVALLEKRLKNNSHTDERLIYLTYYKHFSEKNKGNFGDELSPYIVQKMADCEVRHVDITMRDKLCAIGSMICPYTLPSGTIFWGTGTHHPKMPKKPARTGTSFRAVRGPITRRIVQDAGYSCPEIYGDPGLLMPSFYTPAVAKKYKLGIIPHWRHQQSVQCGEDVKFIDILRDSKGVEAFADDVCECEAILSSSLHGVITAYAYGIPARYIQIEGLPLEGSEGLKFADFFKSVRMPVQEPLLLKQNALVTAALKKSVPLTVDMKINLKLLRDVFPYELAD